MELTLSDGYVVALQAHMVAVLRESRPFPGRDDLWCPPAGDARTAAALIAQGLAERDPRGLLVLTARGREARGALGRSASGEPLAEPPGVRPTLDPALPPDEAERLTSALHRLAAGEAGGPEKGAMTGWRGLLYLLPVGVFFPLGTLAENPWSPLPETAVMGVLAGLVYGYARLRRRRAVDGAPSTVVAAYEEYLVRPSTLDGHGRALLERTQRAVDAVLGSGLHREGLLLDTVRNEVVLAETEWTVARGLADLARSLEEIESTPVTGERSRAAAQRALVALAEERGRLETRIRLLEEYANRVRAAEEERIDAVSARELESIADRITEAGAANEHQEAELRSLVSAQEAALRLAELTEG
ncbi:hypothetical protein [Nocardiopsis sp. CC223A]|uniref:hypothetical protein n=1 Tax=Nocardiopsis sp. CC223A TaxID=3044051 RepID=UPI00278C12E2|nr:hypothetical protein [Nocardiopsis sp. CC223A]